MLDITKAKVAFKEYLNSYNIDDEKIKLKVVHTYGVINAANYICTNENLSLEDKNLALIIALLHDIGRFEQLKLFNSFDDKKFDHAKFGIKVLFEEGLIGKFTNTDKYNSIIKKSIEYHSMFKVPIENTKKEQLHINIIRDADKLDNYRVKLKEEIQTMLNITSEDLGRENISDNILQNIKEEKLILHSDRKTHMDMWVSYLAFVYDLNFKSSYKYIQENDYINKCINRVKYTNVATNAKMKLIQKEINKFLAKNLNL